MGIFMKKLLIASAVAGIFAAPAAVSTAFAEEAPTPAGAAAAAPAAAPASPLTFNVGAVSNYLFRGISQTHGGPALQGGVDYAHPSGFYVGAWASTISWVKDFLGKGGVEIDVYGGYKNAFAGGDWNYDVGYYTYSYPGHGNAIPTVLANPNTQELYGSIGYKWLSAKYSYATSSHFIGWYGGTAYDQSTRGSDYLELNANYDMGDGWTLIGHVGHQNVKGYVNTPALRTASYTDLKLGVSKDIGFGTVTLALSDTSAAGSCSSNGGTSSYCWGNSGWSSTTGPTSGGKDVSKAAVVLSFLKTF
jgi:uncharacterized protein (TIGR02001 family)